MATYTLTIDEKSKKGKSLLNLIKAMNEVVHIEPTTITQESQSPYNQSFVKEIQESRKSKGKVIKTEDLWK
ncbi:DUF2683 family protein [Kiritimatiella glycovorans]|uniref:DUF2683 family protein n=1 Tax=Kiritimatiella glycovorans TaxID=1307763 RepID=UPI0011876105|nr:DUF2683 family protein [Kiritimatiella glycovorans]HOO84556.1 hypothetical protein [Prolixibacteraceae bacterium]HPR60267.1 hypothetical protein [Prolixibacteraceae bacterium]